MAIYQAPALILVPALLVNLAVAVRAGLARRGAAGASPAGAVGAMLLVALGLMGAAFGLFPEFDRLWPIELGLLLGAACALIWHVLCPAEEQDPSQLGPIASGLGLVAGLALLLPDATQLANALIGLLTGWAALTLYARLATANAYQPPLGLVVTASAAAAAAWGEKLYPAANLGAPLAVGVGTALTLGLVVAALLPRPQAVLAGFGVMALIALGLAGGLYAQPGALVAALLLGAAAGLALPFTQPAAGASTVLRNLVALVIAGAILVVDNRLMGVFAIALGGLGLGLSAAGRVSAQPLMTLIIGVFAVRAWLQLFLDRTALTSYGVDLTHPYAFAALILGGLLPFAAVAIARLARPNRLLVAIAALGVTLAPAWVGYFIHLEALGALIAGLLLAAFALGAQPDADGEAAAVVPALLITQIAVALLAAPWLVSVMNATRQERMTAFLLGLLLIAAWMAAWWLTVGRRQAAPAA